MPLPACCMHTKKRKPQIAGTPRKRLLVQDVCQGALGRKRLFVLYCTGTCCGPAKLFGHNCRKLRPWDVLPPCQPMSFESRDSRPGGSQVAGLLDRNSVTASCHKRLLTATASRKHAELRPRMSTVFQLTVVRLWMTALCRCAHSA